MKKILLAFALATASLVTFNSCTKEYITEEYYQDVPSKTMIYERVANQWNGSGNRKYIDLPVQELTDFYRLQGGVQVHMSIDDESNYDILPATINGISYSISYTTRNIRVFAEDPIMETGTEVNVPVKAVFKIILTDAVFIE